MLTVACVCAAKIIINVINIKKKTIIADPNFLRKLSPFDASKFSHKISDGAVGLANLFYF